MEKFTPQNDSLSAPLFYVITPLSRPDNNLFSLTKSDIKHTQFFILFYTLIEYTKT